MQDIFARSFILFFLVLYTGIALAFIIAGFRKWIWRPIVGRFLAQHPRGNYHRIKSTSH